VAQAAWKNAIGAGLHDARLAAQCLTDAHDANATRHTQIVAQFAVYLRRAVEALERARGIVQRHA
jgi:hypothetical protein